MSYVKKKIVIDAEVPDGATHYESLINRDGDCSVDWYKQGDDCVFLWEGMREEWVAAFDADYTETEPTIKNIEVIE